MNQQLTGSIVGHFASDSHVIVNLVVEQISSFEKDRVVNGHERHHEFFIFKRKLSLSESGCWEIVVHFLSMV